MNSTVLATVRAMIFTVCEQPALVCHGPQLPCVLKLKSSSFLGLPSRQRCALVVAFTAPTHAYLRTFGLHEIFKFAHLKFMVYGRGQTDIHTTSANAVTLVWGSLGLAPTRCASHTSPQQLVCIIYYPI